MESDKISIIPYDFDFSGFVGQDYAVPHPSIPIEDVHERYFFSYEITEEEFDQMIQYFRSIESDVYRLCDEATYMKKRTRKLSKKYLKGFFDLLDNPKQLKKEIFKK